MHRFLVSFQLVLLAFVNVNAAELARRPTLGVVLGTNASDAARTAQRRSSGTGVRIDAVLPGLSAEAAGLLAQDVILTLDAHAVSDISDVTERVRARAVGDTLIVGYRRGGAQREARVVLKPFPLESAATFDVTYDAVAVGASVRRVVITRPRGAGRHPAVLLIGGIGCYSADAPLDENDVYRALLSDLTRQGFVTLRVEKSGMGDSTGEPCALVDLENEVAGNLAGLRLLKRLDDVDPRRSFIVGHSIGGIVGPMVAARESVRGLVALETVGLTWFEYELGNTRRQLQLGGASPSELGAQLMLKAWCMHRLLIERAPRAELLAAKPACAAHMSYPASDAYMQQVASQNIPGLWDRIGDAEVAVIYGSADFVTSAAENRAVVDAANAARAGSGTYIEIPDMDHYLVRAESAAASVERLHAGTPGLLHPGVARLIGDWMRLR